MAAFSPSRVNRNFLTLGLGEAVARLVGFGATVYAIRRLGAPLYGMVGVAAAVVLYLNRVSDLGFELGLGVRQVAADHRFPERAGSSVLALRALIALLLAGLLALVGLAFLPQPDGAILAVHGLALLAVGIGTRWVLVGLDRTRAAALATTAGQALLALLVLLLVRGPGDVVVLPTAQMAGDILAAALCLLALGRGFWSQAVRVDWSALRPLLPRAWSLVGSALLGIAIYNADFLFLRVLHGPAAVGYYASGYTLVTFFLNLGVAYNLSLLPSLTRLREARADQLDQYHRSLVQVFAVSLPLSLGGALLAGPIVALLFGVGFAPAAAPFALLIWCIPLNLLRDVSLMGLLSAEGEHWVFRITLWAAVLNLVLNILLIPRYGLSGAAAATVATEGFRMLFAVVVARTWGFRLPGPRRFARPLAAGAAMAAALLLLRPPTVWLGVPLGGVVYLAALTALGGVRFERGRLPALSV